MSEYKRLTYKANGITYSKALTQEQLLHRLAELEDKLESGQLVELKYKKGDYVFFISWLSGNVCEGTVVGWQEDSGYCIVCEDDMISAYECFPTQEAAEERLKELQDKEDCP